MPAAARRMRKTTAALALGIATLFAAVEYAEARRAGSSGFGSRGNRTYSAPAPTNTAPGTAAPMQRTMTPQPAQGQQAAPAAAARQQQAAQPSRGLFGGMGGALLGGLLMGGLFGMLFGGGLGGFHRGHGDAFPWRPASAAGSCCSRWRTSGPAHQRRRQCGQPLQLRRQWRRQRQPGSSRTGAGPCHGHAA